MESDRTASDRNWRRPFWILGHAVLVSSLVLFVIGYVQAATATRDEWFAGGEMNGYSVLTVMVALVIYALVGLWAVIDEIRDPVWRSDPPNRHQKP
jgi:type III secretory pathway component EscS